MTKLAVVLLTIALSACSGADGEDGVYEIPDTPVVVEKTLDFEILVIHPIDRDPPPMYEAMALVALEYALQGIKVTWSVVDIIDLMPTFSEDKTEQYWAVAAYIERYRQREGSKMAVAFHTDQPRYRLGLGALDGPLYISWYWVPGALTGQYNVMHSWAQTISHEYGHTCGLPHHPDDSPDSVMTYNSDTIGFTAPEWEVIAGCL